MRPIAAALLASLALAGCAKKIPNTDIDDSPENRQVIAVVDDYRKAFDARDVQGVMALVSKSYYDDAGTSDPTDDVDYRLLQQVLTETFQKLPDLKLEVGVTDIKIKGDTANVEMFYDARYRVATPRREIPKRDSDVQRLVLRREGDKWKIVTGL
ncbi:MAG TPA: nuclear transport factor 2 family protein [Anaeromyxobacteraceae bacterium]|nr:nuclear transport factor 2 family protein [Anaeromyxobacteraceae bacterium]